MGYQYRGTTFTEDEPEVVTKHQEPKAPKRVYRFDPDACGTYAGYARHQRYNVEPCAPCRKAVAKYIADYRARKAAA